MEPVFGNILWQAPEEEHVSILNYPDEAFLDNTLPNRLAANIEVVEVLQGFEAGQKLSGAIGYGWS